MPDENVAEQNVADPAAGVPASTLENLETNIANAMNDATGTATTSPPAQEPPAATEPEVKDEKAEAATKERIRQENLNLRNTLLKLGIDPDSDTADSLRSGLISPEELLRSRFQPESKPSEPAAPKPPVGQRLQSLQQRLQSNEPVTDKEYREQMSALLDVTHELIQANQNIQMTQEERELQALLERTQSATKNIFHTDVKAPIPDDVRTIGEQMFIGATDLGAGDLARQVGRERAFTPEGYSHVARKLAPRFNQFVNAIYQAGAKAQMEAFKQGNKSVVVNPLAAGQGGQPPPPNVPKNHFALENLDANVNQFIGSTQLQV